VCACRHLQQECRAIRSDVESGSVLGSGLELGGEVQRPSHLFAHPMRFKHLLAMIHAQGCALYIGRRRRRREAKRARCARQSVLQSNIATLSFSGCLPSLYHGYYVCQCRGVAVAHVISAFSSKKSCREIVAARRAAARTPRAAAASTRRSPSRSAHTVLRSTIARTMQPMPAFSRRIAWTLSSMAD
jgi:hypothetical protein